MKATACPECGGPIERKWDTPFNISNPIYKTINAQIDAMAPQVVAAREARESQSRLERAMRETPVADGYTQFIRPQIEQLVSKQKGKADVITSQARLAQTTLGALKLGGALPKPKPRVYKADNRKVPLT